MGRNGQDNFNDIVKAIAALLRSDPSGEQAVKYLTKQKLGISESYAVWRKAEERAYPAIEEYRGKYKRVLRSGE